MVAGFLTISKFDESEAREYLECIRWDEDGTIYPHCGCATTCKITSKQDLSTRVGVYNVGIVTSSLPNSWDNHGR